MSKEGKKYTPKEESDLRIKRILSDADAIENGALGTEEEGVEVLFTEEQIEEAKGEMRYEKDPVYRAFVDFVDISIEIDPILSDFATRTQNGVGRLNTIKDIKDRIEGFEKKNKIATDLLPIIRQIIDKVIEDDFANAALDTKKLDAMMAGFRNGLEVAADLEIKKG